MRFLVDAQLPASLARWLRGAGHEAEHVEDVGLREANDGAIRVPADGVNPLIAGESIGGAVVQRIVCERVNRVYPKFG